MIRWGGTCSQLAFLQSDGHRPIMRLAVHVIHIPWANSEIAGGLRRVASAAEASGLSGISFMDHYFDTHGNGDIHGHVIEGYTALGYMAAMTSRVHLRLLVTGVTYRHPGLLAKVVSTLDVLSRGRAQLGIGAAWFEREHRGLGVPYASPAERLERLEEATRICLQMWSPSNGPFEGRHYQLAETVCSPMPISQPHPPIIVGGGGERRTLKITARYANVCNVFAESPEVVAHKFDVLRRHCDEAGRSFDAIEKTIVFVGTSLLNGDQDAFVAEMSRYAALGVDEVIVRTPRHHPAGWINSHCAPVVGRLAALGPGSAQFHDGVG
jgi:F420-dependent oxidoreductase-like protein